ncbi:hypothetical protein KY339_04920 [Candidatus Woesearchaeota archaeon]|nr:hypothetical protein [Candidatus Woesearchaeota archaeon]
MLKQKRGVHIWMSWVLILTFAVVVSAIMLSFLREYAQSTSEEVRERVINEDRCSLMSVGISELVEKNPTTLNMKITNTQNIRVNQLVFRLYSDRNIYIYELNTTIRPRHFKYIDVPKNGTIDTVEVIPVMFEDKFDIICNNKKVQANLE